MKTFKNLCLTLSLMLSVVACSKEAQDAPQALEPTRSEDGKSIHVGSRDSIMVNFTIGADTEELRLAQSVNAEGVPVSPFMEEKDVVIRFAVRKFGRVTYTDAVCKKIPGESKATYKGVIRLPDLSSMYVGAPVGFRPPMDGHQIAGILLGEADGSTPFVEEIDANTVKSIEQTELLTSENDVVRSKVPYVLDWVDFPLTRDGIQTNKQVLHFKPVGNLLRLQIRNEVAQAYTVKSLTINSNAFVSQVQFSFFSTRLTQNTLQDKNNLDLFGEPNYNTPILSSGLPITPLNKDYRFTRTYTLSSPIRVEPNSKSKPYYLWIMPLRYLDTPDEGSEAYYRINLDDVYRIKTEVIAQDTNGKNYNMLSLCNTPLEGTNSLTLRFKPASTIATAFKGGKLPLWYVAEYNVAPGGTTFMNTHTVNQNRETGYSNHGMFSLDNIHTINIPDYYLPESYDFSAIIGSVRDFSYRSYNFSNKWEIKQVEHVKFPGEANITPTEAIYSSDGRGTIYALRFYRCEGTDRLTAYRYRSFGRLRPNDDYYGPNDRIEVTSIFLGDSFSGDIQSVQNPSFWSSTNSVVRTFPVMLPFDSNRNKLSNHVPREIFYRGAGDKSALLIRSQGEYTPSPNQLQIESLNVLGHPKYSSPTFYYGPVRLFKNEFKTAQ